MSRYLVFAGDTYYPRGGWRDLMGSFESNVEAKYWLSNHDNNFEWWQIVDKETNECVDEGWK